MAATNDPLDQFRALLAQVSQDPVEASCALLLEQVEPAFAEVLRLSAIPHALRRDLLFVLVPDLGEPQAESIWERLSGLAIVTLHGDFLALHDRARIFLFREWWKRDRNGFRQASERLWAYFDEQARRTIGQQQDEALRQRMFHWIGADSVLGIAEFEELCRRARRDRRLTDWASLLSLAHEYDAELTNGQQGVVKYQEAKLAADRGEWSLAQKGFEEVIAGDAAPAPVQAKAQRRLGLVHLKQQRWHESIQALEKALRYAEAKGIRSELPSILHDISVAYRNLREKEQSERFLARATESAEANQDLRCLATCYNSLGTLKRTYGDYRAALAAYEKARTLLERIGQKQEMAALESNIAGVYSDLSDWQKSREHFERGLQLSREAADTLGQAQSMANLVTVYRNLQEPVQAIAMGELAASYYSELREYKEAAVALVRVARVHRSGKEVDAAADAYARAGDLFRRAGDVSDAELIEQERGLRKRKLRLPWWAWALVILGLLTLVAFVAVLMYVGMNSAPAGR